MSIDQIIHLLTKFRDINADSAGPISLPFPLRAQNNRIKERSKVTSLLANNMILLFVVVVDIWSYKNCNHSSKCPISNDSIAIPTF